MLSLAVPFVFDHSFAVVHHSLFLSVRESHVLPFFDNGNDFWNFPVPVAKVFLSLHGSRGGAQMLSSHAQGRFSPESFKEQIFFPLSLRQNKICVEETFARCSMME